MKYVKMLGLAAVAAAALMAFLGAGTASAATVCTENVAPCPAGKAITNLETSLVAGSSASLANTANEELVTCTTSSVTSHVSNNGEGVKATGTITALAFSNCNRTVHPLNLGTAEKPDFGKLEVTDAGVVSAKESQVTVQILGVSCTYGAGAGTTLGTVTQGHEAKLHITAIVNKVAGSFLCPADSRWNADYQITNHTSAFIVPN